MGFRIAFLLGAYYFALGYAMRFGECLEVKYTFPSVYLEAPLKVPKRSIFITR